MNIKTKALLASGVAALIALTGCAPHPSPLTQGPAGTDGGGAAGAGEYDPDVVEGAGYVPSSWKASDGPATFSCIGDRVTYTFTLPTGKDHPTAQKVETFRTMIDAPVVDYVVVNVDATYAAAGYVGLWKLSFATADGTSVNALDPSDTMTEWREPHEPGSKIYEETYAAYNEAAAAHSTDSEINGGGKGQRVFVSKVPVTSMVAPTIYADAVDQAPCYPVDPAYVQ